MAQTTVSVRMDEDLKRDFELICNEPGMMMSTAVTMLAKKMTREQRLPFDASIDPFFRESDRAFLREGIAELDTGRGVEHELTEADEYCVRPRKFFKKTFPLVAPPGATFLLLRPMGEGR